ncbi:MAG: galactokinase [Bacilli bacterium]|nr:galactokinase [Bacilli bacterium]
MKELIEKAKQIFPESEKLEVFFSPGRVNLIGEHIDYNGGYVLPCALDIGTYGVASYRDDESVFCYSENFSEVGVLSFSLRNLVYKAEDNWSNYLKGVLKEINIDKGFNLYVRGDIPNGAGLSSSASLELLVGVVANSLYNLGLSRLELVKAAHKAENDFIGVKCGIMDQFIIGMAQDESGILLNTSNLDYHYVKIDLADYLIIIGNTNKKRTLSSSKYNERRGECEIGLKLLQERFRIKELCELSLDDFNQAQDLLTDPVIYKRVRHVITENERTKAAYQTLKVGNLVDFGRLLNESHNSLRDDYEVTGAELDTLQTSLLKHGALGSRMTGAGFGGCVIALVRKNEVDKITANVGKDYYQAIGLKADFYLVRVGNGARKL